MMDAMNYASRLARAMEHARATTSTLARALGVTYQAIAKINDGRSKSLSAENNDKAARFLGVDPSWLATAGAAYEPANQLPQLLARHLLANGLRLT